MKDADWEQVLKQSLATSAEPDEKLNESILHQLKERNHMKKTYKKKLSAALLATALLVVLSISAYAASQLFSAKEVAEHLGDRLLASAFESKDAIEINESKASGDYLFTLHGLVSGAGLSEFRHSAEEIYPDRTYAVVSITRQDGNPMPSTADSEYNSDPFFISPLIKGQKPWQVNIVTMNGGYSEIVIDGVLYRLIECDQVEIFADRGVYLAISSGSPFFNTQAFEYDETTGEIQAIEEYAGASVLFELPLNTTKADHMKAEAYLEELLRPWSEEASDRNEQSSEAEGEEWSNWIDSIRAKIRNGEEIGETITESIQEVDYDDSGNITYSYDGWSVVASIEQLFDEGQTGFTDRRLPISGDDHRMSAVLFHRDENGVITGRIVILNEEITLQEKSI